MVLQKYDSEEIAYLARNGLEIDWVKADEAEHLLEEKDVKIENREWSIRELTKKISSLEKRVAELEEDLKEARSLYRNAKARIVELEQTINETLDIIEPCLHKWEDADPTDCVDGEVCYQCNTISPKA